MSIDRTQPSASIIDVLDRVLDKGIVIDAWIRVSLVGLDLLTVEARVVVASIDTYLSSSEALAKNPAASKPEPARAVESVLPLLPQPMKRPPITRSSSPVT